MQIRIFSIPITDNGEMQAEMNRFLAAGKVLEIEQRFYQDERGAPARADIYPCVGH